MIEALKALEGEAGISKLCIELAIFSAVKSINYQNTRQQFLR